MYSGKGVACCWVKADASASLGEAGNSYKREFAW